MAKRRKAAGPCGRNTRDSNGGKLLPQQTAAAMPGHMGLSQEDLDKAFAANSSGLAEDIEGVPGDIEVVVICTNFLLLLLLFKISLF